ncbi:MAG TPA: prepilin-type N-terminal cleavage/methylation domain-containing protein [Chlamydiales bacterium]|nr:prepilin-type N-terminal cleavage/methylation domain-containing protein [Chlamydiales bacterium]
MKKKKRALTLLEIMIVIFIITLVTGAIGYNMRGTLDRGRAFRTEQAMEQLHDLLLICLADGEGDAAAIVRDPVKSLTDSGLAKNPKKLVVDGWGNPFTITARGKSDFNIKSQRLADYNEKHGITNETPPNEG